jgi:hypothetical protein
MALMNCPECNKEISDTVRTCPNCGYKIKRQNHFFSLLNNSIIFIFCIIVNIIIGIIGFQLFNKGKSEMFFWVQAKRDLGVEDAMYCIRNIRKYTYMKNVGIGFSVIAIVVIILIIGYKIFLYKKSTK